MSFGMKRVRLQVFCHWTADTSTVDKRMCVDIALGKGRSDIEISSVRVRDEEEEDWKENLCCDESTILE